MQDVQLLVVTLQKSQGDWQFTQVFVLLSPTLPLGHVETQAEPLKKKGELQAEQVAREEHNKQAEGQDSHLKVELFA